MFDLMRRILGELPAEVRFMVYDQLDYGAAIALSQTCRFFRDEVKPSRCSPAAKRDFLSRAERFQRHAAKPPFSHFHTAYACYDCYRILPRDAFSDLVLAEDGALDACELCPQTHAAHDHCPAQGPLLPGDRWSRARIGARVYHTPSDLCALSTRARRSCFDCQLSRGGWWAGQSLMLRGVMLHFCSQCRRMSARPLCYECCRCADCMADPAPLDDPDAPPHCAHGLVVHGSAARGDVTDRYVELMRRGLVHYIAASRSTDDRFLDLVFDPALDRMPPYIRPAAEARSFSDVGDDIVALEDRPGADGDDGDDGDLEARDWPKMVTAKG